MSFQCQISQAGPGRNHRKSKVDGAIYQLVTSFLTKSEKRAKYVLNVTDVIECIY